RQNLKTLSSDIVRDICEDNYGKMWIASFEGLNCLDPVTETVERFNNEGSESLYCLMKDSQGTMWVGSYFDGVIVFNPGQAIFKQHYFGNERGNTIFGSISEDANGQVWVCSEREGVYFLDSTNDKLSHFLDNVNNFHIKSLLVDIENHKIWAGTLIGGLSVIDIGTKKITSLIDNSNNKHIFTNNSIRKILPYHKALILGTTGGLILFDKKESKATYLLDADDSIKKIAIIDCFIDNKEKLWFSTYSGLYCYDIRRQSLQKITLPSNAADDTQSGFVNSIYQIRNNDICFGTS